MAQSVCPYCAVGCAQQVYVKDGQVVQIEGNPDSPDLPRTAVSQGLGEPGAGQRPAARAKVRTARRTPPSGTDLDLDTAMEMVADRVLDARDKGWQEHDANGNAVRRTMGLASLGGATLDNEENYLIKKLFTALGAIQIENQARI